MTSPARHSGILQHAITRRSAMTQSVAGVSLAAATLLMGRTIATAAQESTPMSAVTQSASPTASSPTVVLVHGAFADASGWAGVISLLSAEGVTVLAPANPLRGVSSDAAYIASVVNQIEGPVLLVGHSYGGVVITNAALQTANTVGLVYVAAFAPDEGESVQTLSEQATDSLLGPNLRPAEYPLPDGSVGHELYIDQTAFHEVFCADLPEEQAAAMAVSQRPGGDIGFGEPSGPAAWKSLPSWAVIATADLTIGVSGLRLMAERAGATTIDVDGSHCVMISQPQAVADLILEALASVA